MKPRCYSCRKSMKTTYVRENKQWMPIPSKYTCLKCKNELTIRSDLIPLQSLIVIIAKIESGDDYASMRVNLKRHLYRFKKDNDYYIPERESKRFAEQLFFAQLYREKNCDQIVKGRYEFNFNDGDIVMRLIPEKIKPHYFSVSKRREEMYANKR